MKISNSNIRIKQLISELNISQTEFCKKTGLAKSALSNYMNGDRQPRQDQIDKIAAAYNVNPAWLMGYDVPKDISNNKQIDSSDDSIEIYSLALGSDGHYHVISPQTEEKISELVKAARGCTYEQIDFATDLLNTYSKRNYEKQIDEIKEHQKKFKELRKAHKKVCVKTRRSHESKKTT